MNIRVVKHKSLTDEEKIKLINLIFGRLEQIDKLASTIPTIAIGDIDKNIALIKHNSDFISEQLNKLLLDLQMNNNDTSINKTDDDYVV